MPLRIWGCGLALSAILAASNAWPQVSTDDQPRKEVATSAIDKGKDVKGINLTPSLEGIEKAIRDLKTTDDKIAAEAQQNREIRALKLQEDMTRWAEWMFYATAASVTLTFAALIAVIRTLYHTGRAADYTRDMLVEAKSTTTAALDTVAITKEIGDRQTRPYLTYDSGKISVWNIEGGDPESSFLILDVSFRNGGQSPGILTAASSAIYAPRDGDGWGRHQASLRPFQMVIGANQTDKVSFQTINADALGKFTTFAIGILIWYDGLTGGKFEEHVWLYFDGKELRQDIPFHAHGWDLYRPEVD